MFKQFSSVLALVTVLTACVHHGAVRVQCDGVLRPINAREQPAPVSVTPREAPAASDSEPRP
jgi:hypothetical protein